MLKRLMRTITPTLINRLWGGGWHADGGRGGEGFGDTPPFVRRPSLISLYLSITERCGHCPPF